MAIGKVSIRSKERDGQIEEEIAVWINIEGRRAGRKEIAREGEYVREGRD